MWRGLDRGFAGCGRGPVQQVFPLLLRDGLPLRQFRAVRLQLRGAGEPAYTASLRIDSDGFASLNLDGRNNFYYTERQYGSGHDDDGSYYYFYEDDYELSLYKNGSQLIFWDTRENTATVYLYDLEY